MQTGNNLHLTINKTATQNQMTGFYWKLNNSKNIMFYYENGGTHIFRQNIEFSKDDFSLFLKNVQKNESGDYTAVVMGEKETIIAKHHVTVLGKF